ncbi:TolC family protein [Cupriavidus basilensis]
MARYGAQGQTGNLAPWVAPSNTRTATIGLQLNIPLYAGGGLDSRERESVARKSQAEQEVAAARRDVRLNVQDGFLSAKTGVSRVAALEQSLISARSALAATTLGRDVGTRTEPDVLDAQQRVFAAELDLVQARLDYLLGRLRLAAAAGELSEETLRSLRCLARSLIDKSYARRSAALCWSGSLSRRQRVHRAEHGGRVAAGNAGWLRALVQRPRRRHAHLRPSCAWRPRR